MTSSSTNSLLLHGPQIVGHDRVIAQGAVLIESGRIARIFDSVSSQLPATDTVVDLRGATLFPGFIDIHIHGAAGVDTMSASADDLRRVAKFLAQKGVTAWMPTLVPAAKEEYDQAIRAIELARTSTGEDPGGAAQTPKSGPQARILGVHYEGPFVNSEQCGALHHEHFRIFKDPGDVGALEELLERDERAPRELLHVRVAADDLAPEALKPPDDGSTDPTETDDAHAASM
jgi:N-acetylglucosamine-6-phosphate deacetylase